MKSRPNFGAFFEDYVFGSQVTLIEWFSTLVMFGWVYEFIVHDDTFARATYLGFSGVSTNVWALMFLFAACIHLVTIFWRPRYRFELRFVSMGLHSGLWSVVTYNFFVSGISSTALYNYATLSIFAGLLALRFAWKSSY